MTTDLYHSPEKANLEIIGSVDWSDGNYCFDLTVVWRHTLTRQFFYAEDSGCSCPSPFEDTQVEDLIPITSLAMFRTHLDERQKHSESDTSAVDLVTLIEKLHGLGLR